MNTCIHLNKQTNKQKTRKSYLSSDQIPHTYELMDNTDQVQFNRELRYKNGNASAEIEGQWGRVKSQSVCKSNDQLLTYCSTDTWRTFSAN